MTTTISEQTPVRLGVLLTIFSLSAVAVLGACWWAGSWTASVNTKLDNILSQQTAITSTSTKIMSDVEELRAWRKVIDTVGSPAIAPQIQDLRSQISELKKEIELHKAITTKP